MLATTEPTAKTTCFWLKTVPMTLTHSPATHHDGVNPDGSLYLRHHGGGHNAIMLMPKPPKFLKARDDKQRGRVLLSSTSHAEREWGLVMHTSGTAAQRAGWEPVEIVENEGDGGFEWVDLGSGEELVWKGLVGESEGVENGGWKGWLCTDWAYGHRQLFWATDKFKEEVRFPARRGEGENHSRIDSVTMEDSDDSPSTKPMVSMMIRNRCLPVWVVRRGSFSAKPQENRFSNV